MDKELASEIKKYDQLEAARIIGEPKDPRKAYPLIVEKLCQTDTAEPEDYIYYFDVLVPTEQVLVITADGAVTQVNVTPDTPAQMTFIDVATPEYYIKFTDYAKRKENVLARTNRTINVALNSYETWKVIQLLDSAASTSSNEFTLRSGYTRFVYPDLIDMMEAIMDYGDSYVLVTGSQVDKDIVLWNWDDNKYHDLDAAFRALRIEKVRIALGSAARTFDYDTDGASSGASLTTTDILAANVAYLVAVDTEIGKPLLFVRKKLDSIAILGGVLSQDGTQPERLIFTSPNPITVTGSARYLAVGTTGMEEIAAAVMNPYAVAKFTRT